MIINFFLSIGLCISSILSKAPDNIKFSNSLLFNNLCASFILPVTITSFRNSFIICSFFWSVQLPVSFINFLLFIFVIILILPISFFIQMIVGTIGFYTNSIWGMQILRQSTISIFSGLIAPLTLFPEWFQKIANILPFKEFIYTPINIYLGNIPLNEIGFIILKLIIAKSSRYFLYL